MKQQHSRPTALVVDDEPDIRELLEIALAGMDIDTWPAATLDEARKLLEGRLPDFCLTDMRLPDGSGLELVEAISKVQQPVPVAVITAFGSVEMAVDAMKLGAFDFITKPIELDVLRRLVKTALKLSGMQKEDLVSERSSQRRLLGETPVMQKLRDKISRLAHSQAAVFISGESGTGKELVARLIHEQGIRSDASFVPVNCGAIPADLVESELFGHQKGAFTGAFNDNEGLFQAANGGTLFLDEISELPKPMQVKLLRVLQEKKVRPVGGREEIPVDVRILSASHCDLAELVRQGKFREDLYFRVNVIELSVPPLRERATDIPLLIEYIIEQLARKNGFSKPIFTQDALLRLENYPFPGNVRELENILERVMTWVDRGEVRVDDLALPEVQTVSAHRSSRVEAKQEPEQMSTAVTGGKQDLQAELESQEREMIMRALLETRWNRTAAAKQLGITFRALRYKIHKLGLE